MAVGDTTKQVAGIRERLDKKRSDAAEQFINFSARAHAEAIENDNTLRDLLTNLRLKWREQHPAEPLSNPLLAQSELSEREIT